MSSKGYYEKQAQKLFDDELSEVMTIVEFKAIHSRDMISADLWNRFTSFAKQADESKFYYYAVMADVDYLEKLAKHQGNFELMELVLSLTKEHCKHRVWGAEFFTPKIQASNNGKMNAGITKARWKKLFNDEYIKHKNTLPKRKGWLTLLNIIRENGNGNFDHSDNSVFNFETDDFDDSVRIMTIRKEFSRLNKR
ncbi:hypothetical protein ABXZ88_002083 [Vibrio fluvialis]|nr:hypothetical protein [Vibrio cholerae]